MEIGFPRINLPENARARATFGRRKRSQAAWNRSSFLGRIERFLEGFKKTFSETKAEVSNFI